MVEPLTKKDVCYHHACRGCDAERITKEYVELVRVLECVQALKKVIKVLIKTNTYLEQEDIFVLIDDWFGGLQKTEAAYLVRQKRVK